MAFDLFAIPAMSLECERSFSKASYAISARRSNLGNDIAEAEEVLRSWVSANVVVLSCYSYIEKNLGGELFRAVFGIFGNLLYDHVLNHSLDRPKR